MGKERGREGDMAWVTESRRCRPQLRRHGGRGKGEKAREGGRRRRREAQLAGSCPPPRCGGVQEGGRVAPEQRETVRTWGGPESEWSKEERKTGDERIRMSGSRVTL